MIVYYASLLLLPHLLYPRHQFMIEAKP